MRGEAFAERLYRRLGYDIEARNWSCRAGEIDLIASDQRQLVFCEVKTRRSDAWGDPSEAVGAIKQLRIRRAAAEWLRSQGGGRAVRFDVVSVIVGDGPVTIRHIPDAF